MEWGAVEIELEYMKQQNESKPVEVEVRNSHGSPTLPALSPRVHQSQASPPYKSGNCRLLQRRPVRPRLPPPPPRLDSAAFSLVVVVLITCLYTRLFSHGVAFAPGAHFDLYEVAT